MAYAILDLANAAPRQNKARLSRPIRFYLTALFFQALSQAKPFMQRAINRARDAMVTAADLANVQLLAVETMLSVSASGSIRSIAATALFSRWSNAPAKIAVAANAQFQ